MSIHGICFDEGHSGRCGLRCRGFLGGECTVVDEVVENAMDYITEEDWEQITDIYDIRKQTIILTFGGK